MYVHRCNMQYTNDDMHMHTCNVQYIDVNTHTQVKMHIKAGYIHVPQGN